MTTRKPKPLIVLMEDPIIHTIEKLVCDDPTCICAQEEYAQLRAETAPSPHKQRRLRRQVSSKPASAPGSLNGSHPFRLLR